MLRGFYHERIEPAIGNLWLTFACAVGDFFEEAAFRLVLAFDVIRGRMPRQVERRWWNRAAETRSWWTYSTGPTRDSSSRCSCGRTWSRWRMRLPTTTASALGPSWRPLPGARQIRPGPSASRQTTASSRIASGKCGRRATGSPTTASGYTVPRSCTVCEHPEREAIDRALVGDASNRSVASLYDVSEAAVRRHKANHLPARLVMAAEAAEAGNLLSQVQDLQGCALAILDKAEGTGNLRTALGAIREARGNLELLAKPLGELDERPVVNLHISPE